MLRLGLIALLDEHIEERSRAQDSDSFVDAEGLQFEVTGDEVVGVGGDGGGEDQVVRRVGSHAGHWYGDWCHQRRLKGTKEGRNVIKTEAGGEVWLFQRVLDLGQDVFRDDEGECSLEEPRDPDESRRASAS